MSNIKWLHRWKKSIFRIHSKNQLQIIIEDIKEECSGLLSDSQNYQHQKKQEKGLFDGMLNQSFKDKQSKLFSGIGNESFQKKSIQNNDNNSIQSTKQKDEYSDKQKYHQNDPLVNQKQFINTLELKIQIQLQRVDKVQQQMDKVTNVMDKVTNVMDKVANVMDKVKNVYEFQVEQLKKKILTLNQYKSKRVKKQRQIEKKKTEKAKRRKRMKLTSEEIQILRQKYEKQVEKGTRKKKVNKNDLISMNRFAKQNDIDFRWLQRFVRQWKGGEIEKQQI